MATKQEVYAGAHSVHLAINSLDGPEFADTISAQRQWTNLSLDENESVVAWTPSWLQQEK